MKHYIIIMSTLCSLFILPIISIAQNNLPFTEDGKEWFCYRREYNPRSGRLYNTIVSFNIAGDTIISSHQYKRLFLCTDGKREYYAALRDEHTKTFIVYADNYQEQLLYDFQPTEEVLEFGGKKYEVKYVGLTNIEGIERKTINLYQYSDDDEEYGTSWFGQAYEGIGCPNGIFVGSEFTGFGEGYVLRACKVDDKFIYRAPNFIESETKPYTFVEEGKIWDIYSFDDFGIENPFSHRIGYKMTGDTIIGNLKYKKLYSYNPTTSELGTYITAFRENNKQVFALKSENNNEETLVYDFSLPEKENITLGLFNSKDLFYGEARYQNYWNGYIESGDLKYKCQVIAPTSKSYSWNDTNHYVIERIGHICGPLGVGICEDIADNKFQYVAQCYIEDRLIWNSFGFYNLQKGLIGELPTSSIPSTISKQTNPPTLFDLQGRRLAAPPARGVYIKNGKKVIR